MARLKVKQTKSDIGGRRTSARHCGRWVSNASATWSSRRIAPRSAGWSRPCRTSSPLRRSTSHGAQGPSPAPSAGRDVPRKPASAEVMPALGARPPAAAPRASKARNQVPARFEGGQMPLHHASAQAEGVQEPFPGRVPGRQPRQAGRALPAGWRGDCRRPGRTRAPFGPAGWSRSSAPGDNGGTPGERQRVLRVGQGEGRRCRWHHDRGLRTREWSLTPALTPDITA